MKKTTAIFEQVRSADGTLIGYSIHGNGPALLLIHGGFRSGHHYEQLAEILATRFTVYLMDRRGRGRSGPQGKNYSLRKECEDALAIIRKHDIKNVFGHSFGGLVALQLSLEQMPEKLALYEPAVFSSGSLPAGWEPEFIRRITKGDTIGAMLTFMKGMQFADELKNIPEFLLKPLFWLLTRLKGKDENAELIRQLPAEVDAIRANPEIQRFSAVTCPVLILTGEKSPEYFAPAMEKLKTILPDAQLVRLAPVGHNGPDEENPSLVAGGLLRFF
jgi:pimeloyl-ACP methyl ester carboxylesterase